MPTLLCPASLDDPRKRGALLAEAFASVRERDGADAGWCSPGDPGRARRRLGSNARDAEDHGRAGRRLPRASATVLPADDEAFGLVLVESLAAGTPVVAARSGGCPEIVDDPAIGRLFEPGDAGGPRARDRRGARRSPRPGDRGAPAASTPRRWDWARVVERYEALYAAALGLSAQPHEAELRPRADRALDLQPDLRGDGARGQPRSTAEPRQAAVGLAARAAAAGGVEPSPRARRAERRAAVDLGRVGDLERPPSPPGRSTRPISRT